MKKSLKRFETVLGTRRPTVQLYEKTVSQLSGNDRQRLRKDLFYLAFCCWEELPGYFRHFLIHLFRHDRELLLSYLLAETPLGELRYSLFNPDLVIKFMHMLEKNKKKERISYLHLAFALLISFRYPYKIRTLAEYLRKKQLVASELLQMAGKIEITGDDDF